MELVQAEEHLEIKRLESQAAEFLLTLSYLSLGAMVILIPFRYRWILQTRVFPPVYPEYTNLNLYLADIPLALTLALWLASLSLKPRRVSFFPNLLTIPLFALVTLSAGSIIFSEDPLLSLYTTGRMLLLFALYLYLINEIHNLSLLVIPAGLQILLQSVVGVAQVLRQHSLGLISLQEMVLDPAWNGVSIVWTSGLRSLRAYGLSSHPNLLAGCLALALILLAAGYLQSRSVWRPWLGALFCLGMVALLLTFSRAAWLGLLAGLVSTGLWLAVSKRKGSFRIWAGLCGGCFLLLLPFLWSNAPFLGTRLNLDGSFSAATPENQSVQERSILNHQSYSIIFQHPLTGVGAGVYPEALHHAIPNYPFDYQPPHIALLEVAAEIGLPGALVYLLILIAPWILILKSWKRNFFSLSLVGASSALLAVTVISFLDYYPWLLNPGRMWQWMLWGLWGAVFASLSNRWKHD